MTRVDEETRTVTITTLTVSCSDQGPFILSVTPPHRL